jgi:VWFA-related protein
MNRAAVFLTLITLAAIITIQAQDEDEVIKVDSSLVVLNATITDLEGRPVFGLLRDRFSVFEDGVEQKIEFFSAEDTPFAAVILIDTSGSMEGRVSMARAAAIRFLAGLRGSDVSSIYHFDSKVTQVQEFSDLRDIDERVFELKARGMTALNDAIVKAAEELSKREEKRRAIIVLSDGADTYSRRSADSALKAALSADAVIYTVDMSAMEGGRQIQNTAVLKNFAEKTGGRFVATPGGAQMRQAFEQIVAELGTQYTIAYDPKNTAKDGKWRAIELRVARKNLYIRTRKGYHAPKAQRPARQ